MGNDIGNTSEIWDKIYSEYDYKREEIQYDDWLESFDKEISDCKTPIIDLGCGSGNDTLYLIKKERGLYLVIIQEKQ